MSAKFSARMQASATDEPVWLRIGEVEGHGPGGSSTQRAHLLADGWSFLLTQLTEND